MAAGRSRFSWRARSGSPPVHCHTGAKIKRFLLQPRTIIGNATTPGDKIPATGWIQVGAENKFRGGAEIRAITGTGTTTFLGIETSTDARTPDASYTSMWTTAVTTNTNKDPDGTLVSVSNLSGKLWYRWVWVIFVSSGTGWASVSGFGEAHNQ